MTVEENEFREQLAELQSQMAFQEDTVRALDEALSQQQQEILVLRRQVQWLRQRQEEQGNVDAGEGGELPENERPPHY